MATLLVLDLSALLKFRLHFIYRNTDQNRICEGM